MSFMESAMNKDHEEQDQDNGILLVSETQLERALDTAQLAPNLEADHGIYVEDELHQVHSDVDSYIVSEIQLPRMIIDDIEKITQAWANRTSEGCERSFMRYISKKAMKHRQWLAKSVGTYITPALRVHRLLIPYEELLEILGN
ncbi:hypothetical protein L195_g049930 [Trifolium pratense]|uniref:Uncharacterized protein n=1 Tax=Trifolium pratense TaxID=57577 RepID=A0A2K3JR81_TRIPR|nr:hypothetical protein L195_g049930 [Trifolium pratense]